MLDFIRLNLNAFLAVFTIIVVLEITVAFIKKPILDRGIIGKGLFKTLHFVAIMIVLLFGAFTMLHQTSVNNIPRSTIDRSYTDKTQERYQDRVTEEAK